LAARAGWTPGQIERLQAIALVLPFKLNNYLVDELVDWSQPESDPILRLTMPAIDTWPQFTREGNQIAIRDASAVWSYLKEHTEVQCVLITGGDPLVMRVEALSAILDRLLEPSLGHITSVRIGRGPSPIGPTGSQPTTTLQNCCHRSRSL
jgi:L-lysine 2,3-aminomutase